MGLFQKAPRTAEEVALARPLEIGPDQVQEFSEEEWYAKVYRGESVPQLTVRAVVTGSILGAVLALTNLYVGLKAGWALGVVITAALICFALWRALLAAGLSKSPMGVLEMNCMASTASSAGYATGGTMVSAVAAMLMISGTAENPQGEHLPVVALLLWTAALGFLGTVMAIPMKRNMINAERLRFPTGTAAAVTLQSLYSEGKLAMAKAKALFLTMAGTAMIPLLIALNLRKNEDGSRTPLLPDHSRLFDWLPSPGGKAADGTPYKAGDWTWHFDHDPVMIAAGALIGLRVTLSMLIGGIVLYYGLGAHGLETIWVNPAGEEVAAITSPARAWREAGLWLGVSILVSSSLLTFVLQWRTILRAFTGFKAKKSETDQSAAHQEMVERTEVPGSWFLMGTIVFGSAVIWLASHYFQVPVRYGALAVVLTFVLALVACRATGETDITPTGAMGKIMQLTYGKLIPQNATANLMTASITANAAGNAADLLSDLKSGYLLGANPRRQFLAQCSGVIAGTFATVYGFRALVPDATTLNGVTLADGTYLPPDLPAPAALSWKAVAEVFQYGLQNMHPMHREMIVWGLIVGAAMVLIEAVFKPFKKWLPSATGVGMGMIFGFNFAISMILGAAAAAIWTKLRKPSAENYLVPVAAGVIAGVSLMGVLVAILNNTVLK